MNFINKKSQEDQAFIKIDPLDKIDYNNKASYAFHYFSAINPWKQK